MRSSTKWLIVLLVVIVCTAASYPVVIRYRYDHKLYTLDTTYSSYKRGPATAYQQIRYHSYDTTVSIPPFRFIKAGNDPLFYINFTIDSAVSSYNSRLIIDSSFKEGKSYLVRNDTLYILNTMYRKDGDLYQSHQITLMPGRHLQQIIADIHGSVTITRQKIQQCSITINGNHYLKVDGNQFDALRVKAEVPSKDASLVDMVITNNKISNIDLNISSGYQLYFYDNTYRTIRSRLDKDLLVYGYLGEISKMGTTAQ